jgi:hypothetical protein
MLKALLAAVILTAPLLTLADAPSLDTRAALRLIQGDSGDVFGGRDFVYEVLGAGYVPAARRLTLQLRLSPVSGSEDNAALERSCTVYGFSQLSELTQDGKTVSPALQNALDSCADTIEDNLN